MSFRAQLLAIEFLTSLIESSLDNDDSDMWLDGKDIEDPKVKARFYAAIRIYLNHLETQRRSIAS